MESILNLHLSLAADGFVHDIESFKSTNIALNAEQFVIMLHISFFFVFETYVANFLFVKISLISANN